MLSSSSGLVRYATRGLLLAFLTSAILTIVYYPHDTDVVTPAAPPPDIGENYQAFYDHSYAAEGEVVDSSIEKSYQVRNEPQKTNKQDAQWTRISNFVEQYQLQDKRVLEVGAGTGKLQDVVDDYVGLDLSHTVRRFFHKPFVQGSATALPFRDGEFDVIWTITVIEHVPEPELALREMRRVLKDGGILYLDPAWQCRSWAADGYVVRPYSDFGLAGKINKASIPLRDSVAYRSLYTFPIRLLRLLHASLSGEPTPFKYNALTPNYTHHWTSDADATTSMDPYEAILWYTSRGDQVLNYDSALRQFFVRTGPLIFRIRKEG